MAVLKVIKSYQIQTRAEKRLLKKQQSKPRKA